jgi:hypothetical protein
MQIRTDRDKGQYARRLASDKTRIPKRLCVTASLGAHSRRVMGVNAYVIVHFDFGHVRGWCLTTSTSSQYMSCYVLSTSTPRFHGFYGLLPPSVLPIIPAKPKRNHMNARPLRRVILPWYDALLSFWVHTLPPESPFLLETHTQSRF